MFRLILAVKIIAAMDAGITRASNTAVQHWQCGRPPVLSPVTTDRVYG